MLGRILSVSGVSKRFGGVLALDTVSINVDAGEICGLIGPNGSGKTVLFDIVSGFCQPTGGQIVFDGSVELTSEPPERRHSLGIARTFQALRLFVTMTVVENVFVGLGPKRSLDVKSRASATVALDYFGEHLSYAAQQPCTTLSYAN